MAILPSFEWRFIQILPFWDEPVFLRWSVLFVKSFPIDHIPWDQSAKQPSANFGLKKKN